MNNNTKQLKIALKKLSQVKLLKNETKKLTAKEQKQLLANQFTIDQIKKALRLINTNFDAAAEILCNIPYHHVCPSNDASKEYEYIGSDYLYKLTDSIRHNIRMIDLNNGSNVGQGKIWNNILVLRASDSKKLI